MFGHAYTLDRPDFLNYVSVYPSFSSNENARNSNYLSVYFV